MSSVRWPMLGITDLPTILVENLPELMPSRPLQYSTDQALYDALLHRDDRAYEWLYANLYPSFRFWMTNNNGTEADAEDAFQKGLVSFLANLESGRYQHQAGTKVTTVIFDYCKKVWLTELSSARRRHAAAMPEEVNIASSEDALDDLIRTDTVEAVRTALSELKEGCRQLMQWFYVDERSLRDIAVEMNMKETSVKSKRYECTEQLKRIYQKIAVRRGL
jgi:RNA polymerase sigma factor (sigma-70 family)